MIVWINEYGSKTNQKAELFKYTVIYGCLYQNPLNCHPKGNILFVEILPSGMSMLETYL